MKATNHITNTTMAKKNESNFITDPVQAYFMAKLENVIRFIGITCVCIWMW